MGEMQGEGVDVNVILGCFESGRYRDECEFELRIFRLL